MASILPQVPAICVAVRRSMLARAAGAANSGAGRCAALFPRRAPGVVMPAAKHQRLHQGKPCRRCRSPSPAGSTTACCALYTGEVQVEGVDLNFLVDDNPRNIFDRMAAPQEFDAAEFSSSEYISRFVASQCPFVAIPVFASRVFRHSFIFINQKHIKSPKELEGKRIGVPVYTMTAAIFIRGLLSDEHGIDFSKCEWVEGDINSAKSARQSDHPADRARSSRSAPTSPASRSARCWRTASCRRSSAPACRRRSAATPISCGSIRTIARPRWTTTSAPKFSRSCTRW